MKALGWLLLQMMPNQTPTVVCVGADVVMPNDYFPRGTFCRVSVSVLVLLCFVVVACLCVGAVVLRRGGGKGNYTVTAGGASNADVLAASVVVS
jgi:hypothetical protein